MQDSFVAQPNNSDADALINAAGIFQTKGKAPKVGVTPPTIADDSISRPITLNEGWSPILYT